MRCSSKLPARYPDAGLHAGGKGGIEMVTTRGTYCPFSFGESRIYNFRHEDPVFSDTPPFPPRWRITS